MYEVQKVSSDNLTSKVTEAEQIQQRQISAGYVFLDGDTMSKLGVAIDNSPENKTMSG